MSHIAIAAYDPSVADYRDTSPKTGRKMLR